MLTYKFKLYRHRNNKILESRIDIAGCIYNHCIALHKRYYRLYGKGISVNRLKKHITKLKKQHRFQFWNMLGSQAIQDVAERIDRARTLFFNNRKKGLRASLPTFKKVKKYSSFTLKQAGWKLVGYNRLVVMGKEYRFHKSRNILGNIKTVTVKRSKAGELYVYFVTDLDVSPVESTASGKMAGFDFGLKTFLSVSDGTSIESPEFLKAALNEKARLNRKFAKKKKLSAKWFAIKRQIAKLDEKIANQRKDFFFKLAHELTDKFDVLVFESLNLRGMAKLWGRKVSDLAFGAFVNILEWVSKKKGKTVVFVDRFFASSKTCSCCGEVNTSLTLSDRYWRCGSCGTGHDRDHNAAVNILCEGTSSLRLGDVRPSIATAIAA